VKGDAKTEESQLSREIRMYALCDDGSIWYRDGGEWNKLPCVPQDAK